MLRSNNSSVGCKGSFSFPGRLLNEPSEVPCPDESFYQEIQALAVICFMVVVPVIVTPQRPVELVRICPHG